MLITTKGHNYVNTVVHITKVQLSKDFFCHIVCILAFLHPFIVRGLVKKQQIVAFVTILIP